MLARLITLGTLGYLGFQYWQRQSDRGSSRAASGSHEDAVAGGPLSARATLQKDPNEPPSGGLATAG